jgi:hypothetical protein
LSQISRDQFKLSTFSMLVFDFVLSNKSHCKDVECISPDSSRKTWTFVRKQKRIHETAKNSSIYKSKRLRDAHKNSSSDQRTVNSKCVTHHAIVVNYVSKTYAEIFSDSLFRVPRYAWSQLSTFSDRPNHYRATKSSDCQSGYCTWTYLAELSKNRRTSQGYQMLGEIFSLIHSSSISPTREYRPIQLEMQTIALSYPGEFLEKINSIEGLNAESGCSHWCVLCEARKEGNGW